MPVLTLPILLVALVGSDMARPSPDVDELARLVADGRRALDDLDFPGALTSFEACLQVAPEDADVYGWLALTHLRKAELLIENEELGAAIAAELADAETSARKAIGLGPDRPVPYRWLMRTQLLQGHVDEAIESGRAAMQRGDDDPQTVAGLAEALLTAHQRTLADAQRDGAQTDGAQGDGAQAGEARGDGARQPPAESPVLGEAIDLLRHATAQAIQNAAPGDTLTPQDSRLPQDAPALERGLFVRGHAVAPAYAELSRKLGMALWYAADREGAREAYEQAVSAEPDNLDAHTDLYNFVTQASDQLDPALDFYQRLNGTPRKATAINGASANSRPGNGAPASGSLLNGALGLKWWFQGQLHVARANKAYNGGQPADALFHYAAAEGSFRASAALEKDYVEGAAQMITATHAYSGWALMQLKSYRQAEERFLQSLREQPGLQNAIDGLDQLGGNLFRAHSVGELGLEAVRDFFARITQVVPDRTDWWNNLGLFARDTSQYEKAYEAYRRAAALSPNSARIQNDCALILVHHLHTHLDEAEQRLCDAIRLGRAGYDNATDEATRAEEYSATTDAMSNLALLYHQQERLDDCRRMLDDLSQLQPGRADVILLRAKVTKAKATPPSE
ncbi:MAG: tetratricopeptide repeat protein [Planctomycetota bacterium]